jgi:hypothetical protein
MGHGGDNALPLRYLSGQSVRRLPLSVSLPLPLSLSLCQTLLSGPVSGRLARLRPLAWAWSRARTWTRSWTRARPSPCYARIDALGACQKILRSPRYSRETEDFALGLELLSSELLSSQHDGLISGRWPAHPRSSSYWRSSRCIASSCRFRTRTHGRAGRRECSATAAS